MSNQYFLSHGSHDKREDGMCAMEWVAYLAGEPHSDQPVCVSPVLKSYGIALNDRWDDEQRQKLRPYLARCIGTAGDGRDMERAFMATDWLIREFTPAFLELVPSLADPADAAVLARSNALVSELNGNEAPVPVGDRPLTLGRATAALRHGTLTRRQLEEAQRILAAAAWDEEALDSVHLDARERLRAQTVSLLKSLPPLDEDLRAWIKAAAALLTDAATVLNDPPAKKGGQLMKSSAAQEGVRARDAFVPRPRELEAQTVHDIKGEDRDAVLVVLDRPRSAKRDPQVQLWSSALAGEEIEAEQAEEKRIAFVALTRAKRICVVALPDEQGGREAAEAFLAQGFKPIDST